MKGIPTPVRRGDKAWSDARGPYGATVTVEERADRIGGPVRLRYPAPEGSGKRYVKESLSFSVRNGDGELVQEKVDRAINARDDIYNRLRDGRQVAETELTRTTLTVKELVREYDRRHGPELTRGTRKKNRRRGIAWARFLARRHVSHPADVDLDDWETYWRQRETGAIDARGRRVAPDDRESVSLETVRKDLQYLDGVLGWATQKLGDDAEPLLHTNPVASFKRPSPNTTPKPIATDAQVAAIRAVYEDVVMYWTRDGKRRRVPSFLPAIFDVAEGTGRRINAVRSLRYEDVHLEDGHVAAVTWPAETDKNGTEWSRVPIIAPRARRALDGVLEARGPDQGSAYLFPSDRDRSEPTSSYAGWLKRAMDDAEATFPDGWGWHSLRSRFATKLHNRGVPNATVMELGGWENEGTLIKIYARADTEGMDLAMEAGADAFGSVHAMAG